MCTAHYFCPQVHVLGLPSITAAVQQVGTGPFCMCRGTEAGFGVFELCERGYRPPAIGACPVRIPNPAFQPGAKLGFFHVGLIPLNHQQILNKTRSRLKRICCHIVSTVRQARGERQNTSGSVASPPMCGQNAKLYTLQTQMLPFDEPQRNHFPL